MTTSANDVVGQQIAALKKSEIAQRIGPGLLRFAIYMMRRYSNGDGSMYPSQSRTLAPKFGVCRKTITRWLRVLVDEGVFTVERRCRGLGGGRGRTSNVYRFNPSCLGDVSQGVPLDVPLVVPQDVPTEVPSVHVEAAHEELFSEETKNLEDVDDGQLVEDQQEGFPSLTSLLSTDHSPSGKARTTPRVLSARGRLQREYDDSYADSDLNRDEWNEQWLRDHPDASDVIVRDDVAAVS